VSLPAISVLPLSCERASDAEGDRYRVELRIDVTVNDGGTRRLMHEAVAVVLIYADEDGPDATVVQPDLGAMLRALSPWLVARLQAHIARASMLAVEADGRRRQRALAERVQEIVRAHAPTRAVAVLGVPEHIEPEHAGPIAVASDDEESTPTQIDFEARARARKVAKIVALVPDGATAAENAEIATWLAEQADQFRREYAKLAGVHPPSQTTWDAVVAAVRARRPRARSVS